MPRAARRWIPLLLALLAFVAVTRRARAFTPPAIDGYVTDAAGRLGVASRYSLNAHLRQIHETTGRQIAFLVLDSLAGEPIEDVAYATARAWKPGRAGKDDGVLVVLALDDRKVRIEVGKGIEDRLPDLKCGDIIRGAIAPALRRGEIADAIRQGSDEISDALGASSPTKLPASRDSDAMTFLGILLGGAVFFVGVFFYGRWKRNQWGDPIARQTWDAKDAGTRGAEASFTDGSSHDGGSGGAGDSSYGGGDGDFGGGGASGDF